MKLFEANNNLITYEELLLDIKRGEPVFHRPMNSNKGDSLSIIKSLFRRGFSREYTGDNGGNMYGTGVYNVYNLKSSNEKANAYGSYIVQSYVVNGFKDFLIFNKDIAKKYYGNDYWIGKQIKKLMPKEVADSVLRMFHNDLYMNDNATADHSMTSRIAYQIVLFLREKMNQTKVRGIIYSGGHDGCCAFVRDFTDVIPYSYSKDNGKTWTIGINEELVNHLIGSIDTDFELKDRVDDKGNKQYDDVARKSINGHAIVYKKDKVNYYSVKTRKLISDIWFDDGVNFDENGYADIKYKNLTLSILDDNGEYIIVDNNGIELCTLKELPKLINQSEEN